MLFALSTKSEIALAVMGGIFIAFSIVSAFVFPRRNPDFPGKKWRNAYIVLSVALFLAMMSTVIVFGKEDESANAAEAAAANPTETTSTGTTSTETTSTETTATESTTTETQTTGGGATGPYANGDPTAGKDVFASSGCGACHVLSAAGATGTVGPNLDEKKPDEALIVDRVVNGKGAMPPFKGQLSDQQIADVVAFVYQSTHS
jgi:mono/diheme cytochrome c family protein